MSFHHHANPQLDLPKLQAENVKLHPSTGIQVLVVGAGVGGLMAALESKRKGHDVRVVERSPSLSTAGDFFSIGLNIIRHFHNHWPDLAAECERINYPGWVSYHKITGERMSGPEPAPFGDAKVSLHDGSEKIIPYNRHNRPKFVGALLAQVKALGIEVTFGAKVTEYFDDAETQKSGVILEDGKRIEADVVVAADGVGTKSNKLVNGDDVRAYSSGFSIFRTCFPVEIALSDPDIRDRWPLLDGHRPYAEIWEGNGVSFFVQRYPDLISWLITHKSGGNGMESWSQTVDVSRVFDVTSKIPGFPEVAKRLIKTTPKHGIVDWELMWRDPRENWASPGGRVVQVGDSAHTFLPSSGNGATQAMEDAISLMTCLQIGGRSNIPTATQVHTKLRLERVSCTQLTGFVNHQRQTKPNFEAVGENGESFKSSSGKWIAYHDPEKYAYDNYGKVLSHVLMGSPFEASNIPPGYKHTPWTIKEMLDKIEAGQELRFDGDWS